MRRGVRLVFGMLIGLAIVLGAGLVLADASRESRRLILTGEALFPDYSGGHTPGYGPANTVAILVSLATMTPWFQGDRHELVPTVEVTPGPGVTAVDLVSLRVYLERPSSPGRDIVNGDLALLERSGPTRWGSIDGPVVLFPNLDVSGTNLFLSFALSLNVDYANGRSYGYAGWDPEVRILFPGIVPRLAPAGILLIAAAAGGTMVLAFVARESRSLPAVTE